MPKINGRATTIVSLTVLVLAVAGLLSSCSMSQKSAAESPQDRKVLYRTVKIGDVFRIFTRDRDELARLLAVPQISSSWKQWAEDLLAKIQRRHEPTDPGCC